MSNLRSIVIIIPDAALRRSLAFALEVSGYLVSSFATLDAAEGALAAALCIIADQDALPRAAKTIQGLLPHAARTLLLTEHAVEPRGDVAQVLTKPLSGADVIAAVSKLQPHP
jgi:hypothetical protein